MKTVCQMMYDVARGPHMPERECKCERNYEDKMARWYCLRHGEVTPHYPNYPSKEGLSNAG
jgi:hypothetical protein